MEEKNDDLSGNLGNESTTVNVPLKIRFKR